MAMNEQGMRLKLLTEMLGAGTQMNKATAEISALNNNMGVVAVAAPTQASATAVVWAAPQQAGAGVSTSAPNNNAPTSGSNGSQPTGNGPSTR